MFFLICNLMPQYEVCAYVCALGITNICLKTVVKLEVL